MNETIEKCIINRAEGILHILKDIRKCKSETMIEYGYHAIEGLAGGMIKMIEREIKEREKGVK